MCLTVRGSQITETISDEKTFDVLRLQGSVIVEAPIINVSPEFIVLEEPVFLAEKRKIQVKVQS